MQAVIESIGGIGLFLFGMTAMTSGLRKLAGDRMRNFLEKWTRTPFTGALVGTAATAVLQSSSAVTVTAVGFVAAGMMTFQQAVGIIFGANIGTTMTGWMVALLGFKLKLSTIALPLIFVASILYLFPTKPRLRSIGKALAGFCLIFLGLNFLQSGLTEFRDVIDLGRWRSDSLGDRLLLVFAGCLLTLVTQSSSATVAATLVALNASILTLPQAAAVVIGADVGTTFSAALATIGGSAAARRTGFAHVIYNVLTGLMAFLLLPLYLWAIQRFAPEVSRSSPEVLLVGFHSAFNVFGVLIVLPFTNQFTRLISWLIPEKRLPLSIPFDGALLKDPATATESLVAGVRALAGATVADTALAISSWSFGSFHGQGIRAVIEEARSFAVKVGAAADGGDSTRPERTFGCIHLLDHLERLSERMLDKVRLTAARENDELREETSKVGQLFTKLAKYLQDGSHGEVLTDLEKAAADLESDKPHFRRHLISAASSGRLSAEAMDVALDAHRWLCRVAHHAWRIASYSTELAAR